MKTSMASLFAIAVSAIDMPALITSTVLAQVPTTADQAASSSIAACPGEGDRYGDHKCNHDKTHRVCAQLLDAQTKKPLSWGEGHDFWQITKQSSWAD